MEATKQKPQLWSESDELWTPDQARAYLQIGKSSWHQLLRSGKLATVKIGRLRRVKREDLDRFLERCRENG